MNLTMFSQKKYHLKHDFLVDYDAFHKSDILDIHKHLMVKNRKLEVAILLMTYLVNYMFQMKQEN